LKTVAEVPLPGSAVRFDNQSFVASQGRLYIAHMNADQLIVFDTNKRKVVANLDGFPNVHCKVSTAIHYCGSWSRAKTIDAPDIQG
jgi:hypothetical protein